MKEEARKLARDDSSQIETGAVVPFVSGLSDRVRSLLARCEYRLIGPGDERDAVFRMRYESYLREGAIAPHAAGRLTDRYDEADNAWLLATYVGGRLASSIRLHVATAAHPVSPALDTFPELIGPLLDANRTILDPNRFVADFEVARAYPELVYATLRLPFMAAEFFAAEVALATVRDEHRAFYRRVLRYNALSDARRYPTLTKPLGLMTVDFRSEKAAVLRRYPFFKSAADEREQLFGLHRGVPSWRNGSELVARVEHYRASALGPD
jgi:hypothetical protein